MRVVHKDAVGDRKRGGTESVRGRINVENFVPVKV